MILPYIWQRLIFKDALKVLLFFLAGFTFLYILIDYSVHAKSFSSAQFTFIDLSYYYLCHFAKRAIILVPFALLLASIKVLSGLNIKREMLILFSSGVSSKAIIKPLIVLSLISAFSLYLNEQFFLPLAEKHLKKIEEGYFASKSLDLTQRYLNIISMQDGSNLIYQYYDMQKGAFFDAFWIQDGGDEITRIKYLFPEKIPRGEFVDVIKRDRSGKLTKHSSKDVALLTKLSLNEQIIEEAKFNPEEASLTELFNRWLKIKDPDQKSDFLAQLTYKTLMPLISLFTVFLPAVFCFRFSRNYPIFMIFSFFIFGFITFITLCDAALIVGQNNIVSPFWSLFALFIPLALLSLRQYTTLNKLS